MDLGNLLLVIAVTALISGIFTRIVQSRFGEVLPGRVSTSLLLVSVFAISLTLFYTCFLFASSDMSYDYVWSRSSTDTPLPYRISAVWAGGEGAVLLWTWFMSLVVLAGIYSDRRANLNASYRSFFIIVSASIVLLFVLILIGMDLFAATDSAALAWCPDGCGLKPVLATPEMALHPPVIFASYASCLGLFAASISFFWARESGWSSISLPWGCLTWILLTLGIGIGSVWAYYMLSAGVDIGTGIRSRPSL